MTVRPERVSPFVDHSEIRRGAGEVAGGRYEPDWDRLLRWLGAEAIATVSGMPASALRSGGASVYVPVSRSVADGALRAWATTELARVPGVRVVLTEAEGRPASLCDGCGACDAASGRCGSGASFTAREAVADAVRADLLRMSREDVFEWAVVVSSDARLAPVARLLIARGQNVVHAGFPPRGRELAAACLASVDLRPHLGRLGRA